MVIENYVGPREAGDHLLKKPTENSAVAPDEPIEDCAGTPEVVESLFEKPIESDENNCKPKKVFPDKRKRTSESDENHYEVGKVCRVEADDVAKCRFETPGDESTLNFDADMLTVSDPCQDPRHLTMVSELIYAELEKLERGRPCVDSTELFGVACDVFLERMRLTCGFKKRDFAERVYRMRSVETSADTDEALRSAQRENWKHLKNDVPGFFVANPGSSAKECANYFDDVDRVTMLREQCRYNFARSPKMTKRVLSCLGARQHGTAFPEKKEAPEEWTASRAKISRENFVRRAPTPFEELCLVAKSKSRNPYKQKLIG